MTEFLFDTRAGLMLIGAVGLIILLLIAAAISKPFERWWLVRQLERTDAQARRPDEIPMPPQHEPGRDAFVGSGFTPATTIHHANGSIHTFLLGDEGGTVAEVATLRDRKGTQTDVLELTSLLSGQRGLLTTSTSGLGYQLWAAELRQVVPGADADTLFAITAKRCAGWPIKASVLIHRPATRYWAFAQNLSVGRTGRSHELQVG